MSQPDDQQTSVAEPRSRRQAKSLPGVLLESVPYLIFAVDRDLHLLYTNRIDDLLRITSGAAPAGMSVQLSGRRAQALPASDRQSLKALVQEVLDPAGGQAETEPIGFDVIWNSPGGQRRWRLIASRVHDSAPGREAVVLTCHEYHARGSAAMPDIAHEAAQLDMARQLAATLNHEINNPLFIVSATLEDVLAETGDAEMQRRLQGALDAVWRVASAIKQLQEIRQVVTTSYIEGFPMIDLAASVEERGG